MRRFTNNWPNLPRVNGPDAFSQAVGANMTKTINKGTWQYQTHVLAERYLDVFWGDLTGLFFLVAQPVVVALFAGFIWQGARLSSQLYFVLIFSAIFFGCVNACREIVKEKAIWQRERLVGLKSIPYFLSKLLVLATLGLGQILLFYLSIRFFLVLDGNPILMLVTLYSALLAGTSM